MIGLSGCLVIWGQTGAKSLPSFYLWCPGDISLKFMHILSIDQCSQNQEIRRNPANSGEFRQNPANSSKTGGFRRNLAAICCRNVPTSCVGGGPSYVRGVIVQSHMELMELNQCT